MKKEIEILVRVLSNIQQYFLYSLIYFFLFIDEDSLTLRGKEIFNILLNVLTPFFIVVPIIFYLIIGRTNFKKNYYVIFTALVLTVVIFEFLLKVK